MEQITVKNVKTYLFFLDFKKIIHYNMIHTYTILVDCHIKGFDKDMIYSYDFLERESMAERFLSTMFELLPLNWT